MYFPLEEQITEYHLSNPYGPNDLCFFPYYDGLTSFDQSNKLLFEEEYENNSKSSLIDYSDNIINNSQFSDFECNIFSLNEDEDLKSFNSLFPIKKPDLSEKNENILFDINNISNKEKEKDEKNIKNKENSSDKKQINNIRKIKIFNCNTNPCSKINSSNSPTNGYFRVDNAKSLYKVAIIQFATEEINRLIKESDLPKRLKKKIHLPNSKQFTSNVKELDNLEFLDYKMKDVFTLGKTDDNCQGSNERRISKILNYKYPEKTKKINKFLSSTYKKIIEQFYKSKKFKAFKEKDNIKYITERFKKVKNISLFEENGIIKLFKMTQKKRKRELFCSKLMI